jgi:UDP-3-O-[3-hydroxymyristoyl] N-acetylglucosamine deacetylase / 3-hydroxyacyl-[acyl-carrier-protein] dehydratase
MNYQSTIAKETIISGKGLHTGKQVTLTLKPADPDCGIVFSRVDLPDKPLIHALASNVYDTSRGTSLKENGAEVKTVEHIMAAFAGLQIDNIVVEIDAEEIPILEGSAKIYVENILQAGITPQNAERNFIIIDKVIKFEKPDAGIELTFIPGDKFKMTVKVDYETAVLSRQQAVLETMDDFIPEIYRCRTFVFLHELQFLIAHNLVKGGDIDNAIVFVDKKPNEEVMKELSVFFNRNNVIVDENGTLNHNRLHYENEPARHKMLDLIGDLYLLGGPFKGEIIASKPGHFANVEFAKLIASEIVLK